MIIACTCTRNFASQIEQNFAQFSDTAHFSDMKNFFLLPLPSNYAILQGSYSHNITSDHLQRVQSVIETAMSDGHRPARKRRNEAWLAVSGVQLLLWQWNVDGHPLRVCLSSRSASHSSNSSSIAYITQARATRNTHRCSWGKYTPCHTDSHIATCVYCVHCTAMT